MLKHLCSAMVYLGSLVSLSAEVEYEINVGCGSLDSFVTGQSCRLLELRTYHAAPGKLDALLTRFRDHTCKLFVKHGMINIGYWVPAENPDNLLIYLMAYRGKNARDAAWKEFAADLEWKAVQAASEVDGKLVEKVDQVFLIPTDFSEGFAKIVPDQPEGGESKGLHIPTEEFVPAPAGNEHLFEMRTYTTATGRMPNLQSRFRDHTLALFKKHGMTNLAYFQLAEAKACGGDTLLYFLAHKDMESATKSWADFRADPEWVAAKKASEEKAGGSLTTEGGVKSVFLKPTDFSPVK